MAKLESLKGRKAFDRLFNEGRRISGRKAYAVFLCRAEIQHSSDKMRFAVIAPKKCSKKAVVRNRIKRLLRESIRLEAENHNESFLPHTIAFAWREKGIEHPGLIRLNDVQPEVAFLLEKVVNHCRKKRTDSDEKNSNLHNKSI